MAAIVDFHLQHTAYDLFHRQSPGGIYVLHYGTMKDYAIRWRRLPNDRKFWVIVRLSGGIRSTEHSSFV